MSHRLRQYSVVIHDVPPEAKGLAQAVCQKIAAKYVIALEPYTHQAGHHLHIFYQVKHPSTKTTELNRWEKFKYGRVQVDPMRGTFNQATVYVISPDKDKLTDPSPIRFPEPASAEYCSCRPNFMFLHDVRSYDKYCKLIRELIENPDCSKQNEYDIDYYSECRFRANECILRHVWCVKHHLKNKIVCDWVRDRNRGGGGGGGAAPAPLV